MIRSKSDYLAYLEADRAALGLAETWRNRLLDDVWRYQRLLRRMEYLHNCRGNRLLRIFTTLQFSRLGTRLGFSIPINVFGPGLAIAHRGTIVVNTNTRVGANCRLHVCVNIGAGAGSGGQAPRIGNNCYIAPGAKIFGGIVIGDDTAIGANAVVNKSFPQGGITLAGVPAKVISNRGSRGLVGAASMQGAPEKPQGV